MNFIQALGFFSTATARHYALNLANCFALEVDKPNYREHCLPRKPNEAPIGAYSRNTQITSSHLFQITKALLARARHASQIEACENPGPPLVFLTPCPRDCETPRTCEVLTFSGSHPSPQCVWGQGRVGDVYTGQVSRYQKYIFNGDTCTR